MSRIRKCCLSLVILLVGLLPLTAWSQTVFFNPSQSMPTEDQFTVPIAIECAGLDVKGIEVSVTFDPILVRLDAITAGSWYADATQPFFFFDYTETAPAGEIHFDSAVLDGTLSGAGDLAICHFTKLEFGVTPLDFVDLDVRDQNNNVLDFTYSTGDHILLDPVIADRERTFGAVKSLFR